MANLGRSSGDDITLAEPNLDSGNEDQQLINGEDTMQVDTQQQKEPAKKPRERKPRDPGAVVTLPYTPGKSVFPVSRVQKILKADKDLPMVSREAVLLISLATQEFVKRISEASHRLAQRDKRMTVQRKDIASVCRRADEFFFLEELIPLYVPQTATKRKPKALQNVEPSEKDLPTTMLDQFVSRARPDFESQKGEGEVVDEDVRMNEDGTMTFDSL